MVFPSLARHRLALLAALATAGAAPAAPIVYSFSAQGLGAAAGGTLSGTLAIDMGDTDSDPDPTRGVFNTGVTLSGSVQGGVQHGNSYQNEAKRLFVDADTDHVFSFIGLADPWPVFQLDLQALAGVDPLHGDAMPYLYLEDYALRHEIRFQMPDQKQYRYEITAWSSTALPLREGHAVPLPGSGSLALAGLAVLAGGCRRRRV